MLEEELKFDEQVCIDISKLVYNAFFENNFGKYKNEYIFFDSDETEVELYLSGDAKKLYKYGVQNDKPWTVFVSTDTLNMKEIDRAIWLLVTM